MGVVLHPNSARIAERNGEQAPSIDVDVERFAGLILDGIVGQRLTWRELERRRPHRVHYVRHDGGGPVVKQRIVAEVLIPGRGEPIENGTVVLDGGAIDYAGPTTDAPGVESDELVTEAPVVMPGLWDCHAHFTGMVTPDLTTFTSNPAVNASRATADAAAVVDGGITSVRDVGGLGLQLGRVFAEGRVKGPRVYGAGRILSPTGGHGDIHVFPLDFVHSVCDRQDFSILCDGVPEVLKAVRINLRADAKVIKVCASGGVMSEVDHPIHQQFSDEELAAIVQEAGRAERFVAAHCHGKPGIMAALRAGCQTIEHGSFLDEEAADLMLEKDAIYVPTRFVVDDLLHQVDILPRYAYEKGQLVAGAHEQALKLAVAKGVRIATGCDIFVSGPMYGRNGEEVRHLINAGMTSLEAVESATARGPETLGPQAPLSGQLREGYDADVITLDTNPLDNPSVWGVADRVTHVWIRGDLKKAPAA